MVGGTGVPAMATGAVGIGRDWRQQENKKGHTMGLVMARLLGIKDSNMSV